MMMMRKSLKDPLTKEGKKKNNKIPVFWDPYCTDVMACDYMKDMSSSGLWIRKDSQLCPTLIQELLIFI
jgi:hypothetical protein